MLVSNSDSPDIFALAIQQSYISSTLKSLEKADLLIQIIFQKMPLTLESLK